MSSEGTLLPLLGHLGLPHFSGRASMSLAVKWAVGKVRSGATWERQADLGDGISVSCTHSEPPFPRLLSGSRRPVLWVREKQPRNCLPRSQGRRGWAGQGQGPHLRLVLTQHHLPWQIFAATAWGRRWLLPVPPQLQMRGTHLLAPWELGVPGLPTHFPLVLELRGLLHSPPCLTLLPSPPSSVSSSSSFYFLKFHIFI